MNDHDRMPPGGDDAFPDALRWRLRAERRDVAPAVDLWPGIAARLETRARPASRRAPWLALAASLALAATGGWLMRPEAGDMDAIARAEAQRLSMAYDTEIRRMPDARAAVELAPALGELDRSAKAIRSALERDPDSRLLLDQLRRTYSLRLALSQRAVVG